MSYNLIRNARVFFTTKVDATTGVVDTAANALTVNNTREIQVLDGMSFSQNTTTETVTLNEAGATPSRGQRQFNTALDPVDFSMTTYMRPADGGANITAEESVLWGAMFSPDGTAWTDGTTYGSCVVTGSNVHQLQKFGLIIVLDSTTFIIDDCVLNTATIDFGLDAIASIQWAGQGKALRQVDTPTITDPTTGTSGGIGTWGNFLIKNTSAPYIANKLSIVSLDKTIGTDAVGSGAQFTVSTNAQGQITSATLGTGASAGTGYIVNDILTIDEPGTEIGSKVQYKVTAVGTGGVITAVTPVTALPAGSGYTVSQTGVTADTSILSSGNSYNIALTGGSLTISNNITYLMPANLGVVNQPATYFTGTRAVSGTLNCYLRTGAKNSAGLMKDLLDGSDTDVDPAYYMKISVGGPNLSRVELEMPAVVLSIPSVNTEQVVSSTITFTAQGSSGSAFDIGTPNEINVKYYTTNKS